MLRATAGRRNTFAAVAVTTAALTLVTGCARADAGARHTGAPGGAGEVSPTPGGAREVSPTPGDAGEVSPTPGGTGGVSPAPVGTGGASRPGGDASSDDTPGVRVNDTKARLSYVLPPGWTVMPEGNPGISTSGARAGREWQPSDGIGRPADAAGFRVSTIDGKVLPEFGGSTRDAAETFTNIIACPHEYQGRLVTDTEATRVDGHDAWYSEGECVLPDTDQPPLRIRVTFLDTGGDAVILMGSASSPARRDELAMITKSLRIQ